MVKEVRQSLRPTALVVSMVGGYSASSIASLLRIAPEQVLRPSVGTESGLPLPEAASWPVFVAPQKQETLIGNRTTVKPVSRADIAIAKRAFQDQKTQRQMRCHVLTAYRALLPDAEALRVCMQVLFANLHQMSCPLLLYAASLRARAGWRAHTQTLTRSTLSMQGILSGLKHVILCNDTPIPLQVRIPSAPCGPAVTILHSCPSGH